MSVTSTYVVTGMTCGHCENAVREEVNELSGVQTIEVSSETGSLTITSTEPLAEADVIAAVDEAGYEAKIQ